MNKKLTQKEQKAIESLRSMFIKCGNSFNGKIKTKKEFLKRADIVSKIIDSFDRTEYSKTIENLSSNG